jgi:hypothetical protein
VKKTGESERRRKALFSSIISHLLTLPRPWTLPSPLALPPVEPAVRPLDSRAARQAAARAGAPPSPQFSGGRNDRQGPGPAPGRPDPAVESIRAQERVALDVWSDARFAAAGGAVAGVMLLVFLAKADF